MKKAVLLGCGASNNDWSWLRRWPRLKGLRFVRGKTQDLRLRAASQKWCSVTAYDVEKYTGGALVLTLMGNS